MPSIVINSFPQTISIEPFDVSFSINGAKKAKNYIKVEIYKEGTTTYFSETFNGKDWYSGSDAFSYFAIDVNSSSVSAIVKARATKVNNGDYKLRIKRFTASGNIADDNETPVDIKIKYQEYTPSPTPSQISTTIPTVVITSSPSPHPTNIIKPSSTPEILSQKTVLPTPAKSPTPSSQHFPYFPAFLFISGLFLVGLAIFPFVKKKINPYNEKDVPRN